MNDRSRGKALYRSLSELDPELVAEAAVLPRRSRRMLRVLLPAAACLCLIVAGACVLLQPRGTADEPPAGKAEQLANPITESTPEALSELVGVAVQVPADAEDVQYQCLDLGGAQMAQAQFALGSLNYTYRIQRTAQAEDISGLYYDAWENADVRTVGSAEGTLQYNEGGAGCLNWYSDGCSFSLGVTEGANEAVLLTTAGEIMRSLGYDMQVDAPDAVYSVIQMDGSYPSDMAETIFSEDGIVYRFRTVAARSVQNENISGLPEDGFAQAEQAEIGWCSAQLRYDEGGAGCIWWLDVAPGLQYSLSMSTGATREKLVQMAEKLYHPMQDDTP